MESLKPILKHDIGIANGMLKIQIENLDELYRNELGHEFTLLYKFNLPTNEEHYVNAAWSSTEFTILSLTESNDFTVKVPLFLLPYSLQYSLTIKMLDMFANQTETHNQNDIDDEDEDAGLQEIACMSSINYTAIIPSILMEPIFKTNERVQYMLDHAAYVVSGTVLELLDNDMIKIKTDEGYDDDALKDIVTLHTSHVLRYPVRNCFVIDITNRTRAEIDLILRTNDKESIDVYIHLSNFLYSLFVDDLTMFTMDEIIGEHGDFEYMSELIAVNIHRFLYLPQYNYKIICMFGNSELILEEQWKYYLWRTCKDIKKGFVVTEAQETRCGLGYTCNICRVEVNWYEYVFHCKCDGDLDGHDFCLSCIHSLIAQYNTMKPFISQLLNNKLDDNCIDEIVSFCVGKATKFDIKHDVVMLDNIDVNDKQNIIDDSKNVGSKRCLKTSNSPRKRRRLE